MHTWPVLEAKARFRDLLRERRPDLFAQVPAAVWRGPWVVHSKPVGAGGKALAYLARYVFPDPVTELKIEVDLVADMTVYNPFDFFVEEEAEHWPFDYPADLVEDLKIYRTPEPLTPALEAFMKTVDRSRQRTVD